VEDTAFLLRHASHTVLPGGFFLLHAWSLTEGDTVAYASGRLDGLTLRGRLKGTCLFYSSLQEVGGSNL